MILCNLAAIMGERRLKISKVAADTGISRTTLTALYYDSGKGVQFETANLLCIYFGIGMGELFTTLPFDLFVESCKGIFSDGSVVFDCKVLTKAGVEFIELIADVTLSPEEMWYKEFNITDLKFRAKQDGNSQRENQILNHILQQIPDRAKPILEDRLAEAFFDMTGNITTFSLEQIIAIQNSLVQFSYPDKFVSEK